MKKPIILGSIAVLSWSTVATAFKMALRSMSVYEMLLVASLTALAIFTVWILVTRQYRELKGITLPVLGRFALMGLVMPAVYYAILFKAYDYLPAQVAQPINYIWPILLAVLLAIFAGRPIPRAKYAGMAVSLAGVAVISLGGASIEGALSPVGLGLALLSALLWALYWIINNSLKDNMSQGPSMFLTFLFGSIYLLAAMPFFPIGHLTWQTILPGAYIGAFEMGIPLICFGIAIRTTDNPALINQLCYLGPFLSLFIIAMMLGEPIAPSTFIGLLLIVAGLVYNEFFADRTRFFRQS